MALFTSYAPPGVYTIEIFNPQASAAIGTSRIPVIIGEGQQFFSFPNIELFRGSSAVQDDQAVNEDISNQVTGFTRQFVATYFPVTDGTGKGVVTNDPSKMQVISIDAAGNQLPVTVISLVGATGVFSTQDIIPLGTQLKTTYFFKRGDTLISNEDLSAQIPVYATLLVQPSGGNNITLSLTTPGELGNLVTVQFVDRGVGNGVPDAQAVIGAGTDQITFEIRKPGDTMRTLADLQNIVQNSSIPTLDGGFLTAGSITGVASTALIAGAALPFINGAGPSSNTVFKVKNVPIVDGTNGGVITTNPANVTVMVSGIAVAVSAVDGAHGLITLANPVASTASSFTITYFTNTWQNTFDLLPASNVASITAVGLGPNRSDFANGVDYVLGTDAQGNGTINWGASTSSAIGVDAAGDTAFSPSEVNTSLVDDQVYLRPVSGAVNGKNTVYTLQDSPVDGSGLSRITDDLTKVSVYVGADALEAFLGGAVKVARLQGAAQTVTLYNPPPAGSKVFASYFRSILTDNVYTLTVVNPGFSGLGTYTVADQLGRAIPLCKFVGGTVAASGAFATTGVVYPFGFGGSTLFTGDLQSTPNAVDETVTLTFLNDGNVTLVPAVQASHVFTFGSGTLTLTAAIPGAIGNNVKIAVDVTTSSPVPVVVNGDLVTIFGNWDQAGVKTTAVVASYFPSAETASGGQITAVAGGTPAAVQVTAATALGSGADAISTPVTHSYNVTSTAGASGSAGVGYLDQTYIDARTGFRVTVVNPADHAAYGVPTIPSNYVFAVGDTLQFSVAKAAARHSGNPGVSPAEYNNFIALSGLHTKVSSTQGSTAGDTVLVSTFNKSGNNPSVGSFYFVSFTTNKTAADFALKLFTNPSDAYAQYGQPSTINRLSLGIQLMSLNGVQSFGAIQVPVQPGTNLAASSDYIAALQQLTKNLPGFNSKANVIVPLSNDPSVHQALSRQLITQAGIRFKGEAIGFVGYSQFTTPAIARANARALKNSRMIAIGNAAAGILITNPTTGVAVEYPVDGTFMAAALAGLNCNPANDVATTLTLQNLAGFSRLLLTYDDPTMDFMAADGLTMLLNNNGALQIRHYKTTDPSNVLTSEPTSVTITDFVAQQFRLDLQQFIGRKLVDSLVTDIQVVCNARLKSLVDNVLISGYQNLSVVVDPSDPTVVDVTVTFKPIFSLLYAQVTFVVQTSL